jgi:hypothetical protein
MLLMKRANKEQMKINKKTHYNINNNNNNNNTNGVINTDIIPEDNLLKSKTIINDINNNNKELNNNSLINLILEELKFITRKIKTDQQEDDKSQDWKFTAMVIDRFCLVIFVLATFISTAAILLTSKNFFRFR